GRHCRQISAQVIGKGVRISSFGLPSAFGSRTSAFRAAPVLAPVDRWAKWLIFYYMSGVRDHNPSKTPKKRRAWLRLSIFIFVLALVLAVGRAILPWFVRDYVNRTLDRNPLYSGNIGQVQIHLLRGAYSIHDVRI